MVKRLLRQLLPSDKQAEICVQVKRKWAFTGTSDDGVIKHIDLILADVQGNSIYAEIPQRDIDDVNPRLTVNGIYTIRRFKITSAKTLYIGYANPYMIELGYYTQLEESDTPVDVFPKYVYRLFPFNKLDVQITGDYFVDIIGIITGVTDLEPKRICATGKNIVTREAMVTDLNDGKMKVKLWGDHATNFSIDAVYDENDARAIVVLFVGCLTRVYDYVPYLSGGSAYHWYFNPDIEEAQPYYQAFKDRHLIIPHPAIGTPEIVPVLPTQQNQHKTLGEINDINPYEFSESGYDCTVTIDRLVPNHQWWYIGCDTCRQACISESAGYFCRKCNRYSSTFMYKLAFIAKDGPAEAELLCFDAVA